MIGKIKNWRRTTDDFLIFLLHLQFLIKFNKTAVLPRNRQKMPEICGDTAGDMLRGVSHVSYWEDLDMDRKMRPSIPTFLWSFPKVYIHYRYSLSVAEKVSNTLFSFPN
jgi:hypothetical protein